MIDLDKLRDKIVNKHCLIWDGPGRPYYDDKNIVRFDSNNPKYMKYWSQYFDGYYIGIALVFGVCYVEYNHRDLGVITKQEFYKNVVNPRVVRNEIKRLIGE